MRRAPLFIRQAVAFVGAMAIVFGAFVALSAITFN